MKTTLTLPDAWTSFCNGPTSIPLEVAGGRYFAEVDLSGPKGSRKVRFHIDTGGSTLGLSLDESIASDMGYSNTSELPKRLSIAGQAVDIPKGASWALLKRNQNHFGARKGYSRGQIGAGFLSRFIVCIDPTSKRLALADPTRVALDPTGAWIVPFTRHHVGSNRATYPFLFAKIMVRADSVGGYGLLLDTGAPYSMLEQTPLNYQHKTHSQWPYSVGAFGDADMVAGALDERVLRVPQVALPRAPAGGGTDEGAVELGEATFVSRPNGSFAELFGGVARTGAQGALGNDVLARFRLLIDYEKGQLILARTAEPKTQPWQSVGLNFEFSQDGCPSITRVAHRNIVARNRIKINDRLLEIDQVDVCQKWHHEIVKMLSGSLGATRTLTLSRAGKTVDVKVPVIDLFRGN